MSSRAIDIPTFGEFDEILCPNRFVAAMQQWLLGKCSKPDIEDWTIAEVIFLVESIRVPEMDDIIGDSDDEWNGLQI